MNENDPDGTVEQHLHSWETPPQLLRGDPSFASSPQLRRSRRLANQEPEAVVPVEPEPAALAHAGELETSTARNRAKSPHSDSCDICGRISAAFGAQPPRVVRTGSLLPRLVVRLSIEGNPQFVHLGPSLGIGTLHAMVSLWSGDGQVAVAHTVPPLLTGHRDATMNGLSSSSATERHLEASFSDLVVGQSGHYRLRVSIMETPLPEGSDGRAQSPRQLLSIETQPFHAHAFA